MSLDTVLATKQLSFKRLHSREGLQKIDALFCAQLPKAIKGQLEEWRQEKITWSSVEEAEFQIILGEWLNRFLVDLFGLQLEADRYLARAKNEQAIMQFKERFIQRGAKRYRKDVSESFEVQQKTLIALMSAFAPPHSMDKCEFDEHKCDDLELAIANYALTTESGSTEEEVVIKWAYLALNEEAGQELTKDWMSFKFPQRIDPAELVHSQDSTFQNIPIKIGTQPLRHRDGFALTDTRMTLREVASEIAYCKYCHDHEGDFCSIGFPVKKAEPELGFRKDFFGNKMIGCPLDEKISEMQRLEKDGLSIGALAMIMVENPMVPATGHRICNDCMKSCIYQRQEPVDIPQVETSVLSNVLNLSWGVEIYDLLTRWNPLKPKDFLPKTPNHRQILVVGMGPAGFTMAHYLSQEGCSVTGVDGLKIEPLPPELLHQPIKDWKMVEESLDNRILYGFGGVAEYGITVRWDKNFLKLLYITLARRDNIHIYGGVRFGGTLTLEDAFELGFDHVSLAVGAGLPRVLKIDHSLARGMKQASDFLMAMQLTGAGKESSLANLQVRLPAVVIGGGLTAIDTATELQAYYLRQVEKVLRQVEILGEETIRHKLFTPEDEEILTEFLTHGREVNAERERAKVANEKPNFIPLLHKWGGVLIAYRRTMEESPAYTLNHQEITKAFEEGIYFGENLHPEGLDLDQYGHVSAIRFTKNGEKVTLAARAILVAAGTSPNTIYATEYSGSLALEDNHHFQGFDIDGKKIAVNWEGTAKDDFAPFTSFTKGDKRVTYLGDTHPTFNGNVVKAIASAKYTYPKIMDVLNRLTDNTIDDDAFSAMMEQGLVARVQSIDTQNTAMTEIWIKAPFAAKNFKPGQFFRLQTFEQESDIVEGTRLQIPLLTVSGTGSTEDAIRLLVFQWGTGQRLVPHLKVGQRVILAGPTGAPTDIPKNKTILAITGNWGAAIMLDISTALRANGNRVIYLATLGSKEEANHMDELEAGSEQVIWCVQRGEKIVPRRPQDLSFEASDMIQLLWDLNDKNALDTLAIDRIMAMGSTGLLKGLQQELSKNGRLFALFKEELEVMGTIGSPMQCMMKGVCGQCLQWQVDPETGERTQAVFICANQDQSLKEIDLDNVSARGAQNRLLDIISSQWLTHVLNKKNSS